MLLYQISSRVVFCIMAQPRAEYCFYTTVWRHLLRLVDSDSIDYDVYFVIDLILIIPELQQTKRY